MTDLVSELGRKYAEYESVLNELGLAFKTAKNTPEYKEYQEMQRVAWDAYNELLKVRASLAFVEDPSGYLNKKEFYE